MMRRGEEDHDRRHHHFGPSDADSGATPKGSLETVAGVLILDI